jgi:hypothetical protein
MLPLGLDDSYTVTTSDQIHVLGRCFLPHGGIVSRGLRQSFPKRYDENGQNSSEVTGVLYKDWWTRMNVSEGRRTGACPCTSRSGQGLFTARAVLPSYHTACRNRVFGACNAQSGEETTTTLSTGSSERDDGDAERICHHGRRNEPYMGQPQQTWVPFS